LCYQNRIILGNYTIISRDRIIIVNIKLFVAPTGNLWRVKLREIKQNLLVISQGYCVLILQAGLLFGWQGTVTVLRQHEYDKDWHRLY